MSYTLKAFDGSRVLAEERHSANDIARNLYYWLDQNRAERVEIVMNNGGSGL